MTSTIKQPEEKIAAPRAKKPRVTGDGIAKAAFIIPVILFMVIFFAYPLVQNFTMSFQEYTARTFVTGEAPWKGLDNYREMIGSYLFRPAFWNTLTFTFGSIIGQFIIGMWLATLFRRRFPLNNILRALLLLPWLLPLIVTSAVWRAMLEGDIGLVNRTLGLLGIDGVSWLTSPDVALFTVILVNIWAGIPFNVAILYSGLQSIPEELYEAGALDGAVGWKAFWHITLPNLRPVIAVVFILGFIYTVRVLDLILALTQGGPANSTQTLAIRSYEESFVSFNFGVGAAYNNLLMLLALIFAAIYLRINRRADA